MDYNRFIARVRDLQEDNNKETKTESETEE